MKILLFAIFLLVSGLLFVGLNKLICKLAYPKNERFLHCRLIFILFFALLILTNVFTVSLFLKLTDSIINAPALAGFFSAVLPNRAYGLTYMLLTLICLNLIVMVLALVIILISKRLLRNNRYFVDLDDCSIGQRLLHLHWAIVNRYYDDNSGSVQLNSTGFSAGIWAAGFKRAFATLWIAEFAVLAVAIVFFGDSLTDLLLNVSQAWYLLPAAGYLLLEQVQLFLEGTSEHEAGSFGSANIYETQENNLIPLFKKYHDIFAPSGALILSDLCQASQHDRGGLGGNDLGNRQIGDCTEPEVLTVLTNQLQQCGAPQCEQYQNALIALLNGRNINVCDHPQGEFLPTLTAYLNFHMSQGKTALVLCKDSKQSDQLCQAINREMHRLNSLYSVWNIRTLEGAEDNSRMSMLVCSFDDFLDHCIVGKRRDFTGDLFCTVIADGFELFSRDSIRVGRLFSTLRSIRSLEQYVVFSDVNNDALRTSMEQSAKIELLPFCNDNVPLNTGIMVWSEKSFFKLQRQLGIGNALSPYMGTALPISLVAVKYDLPTLSVLEHDSRGDHAFRDVLAMTAKEVFHYLEKEANLNSIIRRDLSEVMQPQELSMLIAYDTDYNFFNALWRWMKYGGTKGTLLHIVSPSYILQEYFAANYASQRLLLKNNEFDALISYHLGMKISHMAALLVALCNDGLTEDELMEKNKEFLWGYETVKDLLADCLKLVLAEEEVHNIYECFHFEEKKLFRDDPGRFEVQTRITLTDETIRSRLQNLVGHVSLICNNDQEHPLPILRGNLMNYYLRGQLFAANGHIYQIQSVSNGKIYAEQTLPLDMPDYFQISAFSFDNYQRVDQCVDSDFLDLNICTAAVTREVFGYWSCNRGNQFAANCDLQLNDLRDEAGNGQSVRLDCANILELNIKRSALGDQAGEAALLMAYVLKEMFKTLFPVTHQNLFTAVSDAVHSFCLSDILTEGKDRGLTDIVRTLIPQIKHAPAQNEAFITVYVIEFSCVEYGMVQMLYNKYTNIMMMLREYLAWYLASNAGAGDETISAVPEAQTGETAPQAKNSEGSEASESTGGVSGEVMHMIDVAPVDESIRAGAHAKKDSDIPQLPPIPGRYLHFGSPSVPEVFDLEALLEFCRKLLPEADSNITESQDDNTISSDTRFCTFCGRPSLYPTTLSDGRLMCAHCKDHQLTQKDEIKDLFLKTVQFLTEGYSISLPKNIHVRFQSADAIMRATGVTNGRVLGFYCAGNRQLWLEARGPRVAMQATLIHELTHAWQFHDSNFSRSFFQMLRMFPRRKRDIIRLILQEGHAIYTEIETMRKLHEDTFANRLHRISVQRDDEYGIGYRLILDYLQRQELPPSHLTPFTLMQQLVQDIIDKKETLSI